MSLTLCGVKVNKELITLRQRCNFALDFKNSEQINVYRQQCVLEKIRSSKQVLLKREEGKILIEC